MKKQDKLAKKNLMDWQQKARNLCDIDTSKEENKDENNKTNSF